MQAIPTRLRHAATLRRVVPAAVVLFLFGCFAALYLSPYRGAYMDLLWKWGIAPYSWPFLDTDTVLSALRCRRLGVDVFVENPCDPLGRVFDYSPLWLAGAVFPVTTAWIVPVGLTLDLAFIAALCLLPAPRGRLETGLVTFGAISTAVVFAMERGNNDLSIFILAVLAGTLLQYRSPLRFAGYGLMLLAGLLKYYPLLLLGLAVLRERRWATLAAIALAAIALCVAFLAHDGRDLLRALALIPHGSYFGGMFGAQTLPRGLGEIYHLPPWLPPGLELALVAAAVAAAWRLSGGRAFTDSMAGLSENERVFLITGAIVTLSCFLTAQNIGYRQILLLLPLPGITALRRCAPTPAWRRAFGWTVAAMLFLLWSEFVRRVLDFIRIRLEAHWPAIHVWELDMWLVRELAWWWVATMFATSIACQLRQAPLTRGLRGGPRRS